MGRVWIRITVINRIAERVGFEPTIPLPVYHLSRVANSTALAPLRKMTVYYIRWLGGEQLLKIFELESLNPARHFIKDGAGYISNMNSQMFVPSYESQDDV